MVSPFFDLSVLFFAPTRLGCSTSPEERPQHIPGHRERALPAFQRPAEGVVLDLDTNGTAITGLHQPAHEPGPIHLAIAGDARLMPLEGVREDTDLVDAVAADPPRLGREGEQPGLAL